MVIVSWDIAESRIGFGISVFRHPRKLTFSLKKNVKRKVVSLLSIILKGKPLVLGGKVRQLYTILVCLVRYELGVALPVTGKRRFVGIPKPNHVMSSWWSLLRGGHTQDTTK